MTKENPNGLLTKSEMSYVGCLEIRHRELENLLRQDLAFWKQNQKKAKSEANGLNSKMEAFMAQTMKTMQSMITIETRPIFKNVLSKLPCW